MVRLYISISVVKVTNNKINQYREATNLIVEDPELRLERASGIPAKERQFEYGSLPKPTST